MDMLHLKDVRPTVFFVSREGRLDQIVEITVENRGKPVEARVKILKGARASEIPVGPIKPGEGRYQIAVPEIGEEGPVEFALLVGDKVQDRRSITWRPKRHWEVYLVHISHHDLGYTDLPRDVLREHDGFMDEILRFCEETEDWPEEAKFRYTIEGSWSVLHFVEEGSEDLVEKLVRYMKQGRIELTAFFGNETTELCGHEELIRLLYPSFGLGRRYGIPIRSAEVDDIPGLSWGLATVLAGAGVRYLAAGIPDYFRWKKKVHFIWDESEVLPRDLPGAFWWEGPDGGKVLFWYCPFGGSGWSPLDYEQAFRQLPGMLEALEEKGYPFEVVRFRFIGGHRDNSPPDVRLSQIAKEWNRRWAYPRLIVSTNSQFFERLEKGHGKALRTFRGELPDTDYTVGATSTAKETGVNRRTHDLLNSAEKFATIASAVAGYPYPEGRLREAYENMLLYDEHTWGQAHPIGPAQEANWSEKACLAYRARALAHDTLSKSLNRIVDHIELAEDGYHIVVFNPLSWRRTDLVRVLLREPAPCGRPMYLRRDKPAFVSGSAIGRDIVHPPLELVEEPFDLIDLDTGRKVPYQMVRLGDPHAPMPWAAERYAMGKVDPAHLVEMVFVAEDVPPLGYKTYRIVPAGVEEDFATSIRVGDMTVENRFFKVSLDPETGAINSIYDKELGREIVDRNAPHKLNQFIARWAESGREEGPRSSKITKGELGPVYGSLMVKGEGPGCPEVVQEVVLYDRIKRIDLANRLLKDSTPLLEIYFAFPFDVEGPRFRFEGSCSVVEPLKDQFPGSNTDTYAVQHWVEVQGGGYGIIWTSLDAPVAEFGGLWPGYVSQAHHGVTPPGYGHEFLKPGELKKGHIYSYVMDNNFRTNFQPVQVGDVLFRYCFTVHRGDLKARDFGWGVSNPLIPVCIEGPKDGRLPKSGSFCEVDEPNVMLLALKRADDGNGLVVRLVETEGRKTVARLQLSFTEVSRAWLVNLVEEDIRPLEVSEGTVRVPIGPFGIATVRVKE
ncbi:MAG: hypothetical protein DRP94_08345 [Candidatus Latescibacterota bacterium]|nr:MAG: hypothetical protein DRP94_08345 [Candidatus Latescibacterota bacterium]